MPLIFKRFTNLQFINNDIWMESIDCEHAYLGTRILFEKKKKLQRYFTDTNQKA
jgi:hypothetical protein